MARPLRPRPLVKICGLSTVATLEAALAADADQIGLVFFPKSPRHVSLDQARTLAGLARGQATIVALTVDADDAAIDAIMDAVSPDWLQLHGRESPARVAAVRQTTRRPVMKAIGIAEAADLAQAEPYRVCADRILFDAKPPRGATLPGGNGVAFDWPILRDVALPYMLSGGLTPATVGTALAVTGAKAVDVSSGVETAPGLKDAGLIAAFVAAARQVGTPPAPGLAASRGLSDRTQIGDPS
ncbi:phosphoribosylanthranilate isomerase [Lichenihabitans sp. Uapishka_5]|uniref:phosphoribosylanthranilate isomerase n=1 Tax=Lichenihabitans sp. Uapishka_5 TaxID=3037302 RepID=UPI0029E7EA03|nr:phosphoribosylanthranilate isomerase [Lichenihabitans sp. Uapishka_5]MDX7949801.1 phosphoribosylanthranilate isomerase [Lichenihabitans sp. Uapishka_5]